jgi:hypothetical protein
MERKTMTLREFLDALPALQENYAWDDDSMGMLRGFGHILGHARATHNTITALAQLRTCLDFDPLVDWDKAAEALGLCLDAASEVISAEDRDMRHDPRLATALRYAVGMTEEGVRSGEA